MTDTQTELADIAPTAIEPRYPTWRSWPLRAWRQLTSMRTALILLFVLALAAIPGSFLPQRGLNPIAVTQFFHNHPTLAPVLDDLSMFDVFAAPWFAAIYLLLMVSVVGCVVPRTMQYAALLRSRPPKAPAHPARLPHGVQWSVEESPNRVVTGAADLLRRRRWRVVVDGDSVAAEKGFVHEAGNLVFHASLLVLLLGVALGGLFGYKGATLVVEGNGFANTLLDYDTFHPGRLVSSSSLSQFSFTLDNFRATYQPSGEARSFDAQVSYRTDPGAALHHDDIRVNHPLRIGGAKIYLVGHGYAPVFVVRGADGKIAYSGPTPFLPQDNNFTSIGVVKVPDARPAQLGFSGFLTPTTIATPTGLQSAFPALVNPVVTLLAWRGDLGLDSGVPQSVYRLDTTHLTRVATASLAVGETLRLPGGGSITYASNREWATFQIAHDPGKGTALIAAVGMLIGLVVSLRVRRRRVWLRAADAGAGRTVVELGGLTRSDSGNFSDEFADLTGRLRDTKEDDVGA